MKKTPARAGLLAVPLAFALAGCGHHGPSAQTTPSPASVPAPTAVSPSPAPASGTAAARPHTAVIYVVDAARGTGAGNYLVPKTIRLRRAEDPAREALDALLAAPHGPIPAGTTLNSVKIADGLATVDFSRSPVDENGGEEGQSQALEAIQRTLGQFPDVERIQITVNGQAPASLGEAAGGPMDVIRPGAQESEAGGA